MHFNRKPVTKRNKCTYKPWVLLVKTMTSWGEKVHVQLTYCIAEKQRPDRKFVCLQQEDKRFAHKNRKAAQHHCIETLQLITREIMYINVFTCSKLENVEHCEGEPSLEPRLCSGFVSQL